MIVGMKIYRLNRTVLSVKNNAVVFLNGLSSNTLAAPQNALVNIHGKIIAAFDQVKISGEEFWIVVESDFAEAVLKHLETYARLAGVKMEALNKNVYFDLEANAVLEPKDSTIPQKRGRLIITDREIKVNVSENEFNLFRLQNNIPMHGVDFKHEFLLNVSEVDYISFTKGCFLGQEPLSKVHNRSKPTWKLVVKYEDECSAEEKEKMTSKTADPSSGRSLGFVFVKNQD